MEDSITQFEGEYHFLSNFYKQYIVLEFLGHNFHMPTAEHAFQAAKARHLEDVLRIQGARTPGSAKRLGRQIDLRPDWDLPANDRGELTKVVAMRWVLTHKFRDPQLRAKLLATQQRNLVEGNTWGDTYWGMCLEPTGWRGQNWLGVLLMDLRTQLSWGAGGL